MQIAIYFDLMGFSLKDYVVGCFCFKPSSGCLIVSIFGHISCYPTWLRSKHYLVTVGPRGGKLSLYVKGLKFMWLDGSNYVGNLALNQICSL